MIDLQSFLVDKIPHRFRELRENIPPDLISYGQKSAIYNIEKGKVPKSGNFISDSLLEDYVGYFKISREELIFGNSEDFEQVIDYILMELLFPVIAEFIDYQDLPYSTYKHGNYPSLKTQRAVIELLHIFADFARWYGLRKGNTEYDKDEFVDYLTMMDIVRILCKNNFGRIFKEKIIQDIFNDSDEKFHFNRINKKLDVWLSTYFSDVFIPETIGKLRNNSIFKLGFIVKTLTTDFLVDLPESYLEEIPIEYNIPPLRIWEIPHTLEAERLVKQKQEEHFANKVPYEELYKGIEGAVLKHKPEKVGLEKRKLDDFIDGLTNMPSEFSEIHALDHGRWKIPGILTSNSQASNEFQKFMNNATLDMINHLIAVQNHFINCIKREELANFL